LSVHYKYLAGKSSAEKLRLKVINIKTQLTENRKNYPQQEKPVSPNHKNLFPQNAKNRPSAKLNSRKNLGTRL